MKCPHCGKEIPDDSRFCHYCGIKIKNTNKRNTRPHIKAHEPEKDKLAVMPLNIVDYKHKLGFDSGINNVIEVVDYSKFQSYAGTANSSFDNDDESGKQKAHYVMSIEKNGILLIEIKVIAISSASYEYGRDRVSTDCQYELSNHHKFIPKDKIKKFSYHHGWIFEKFLLITDNERYNFTIASSPFGDDSMLTQTMTFQHKNHQKLPKMVSDFDKRNQIN